MYLQGELLLIVTLLKMFLQRKDGEKSKRNCPIDTKGFSST